MVRCQRPRKTSSWRALRVSFDVEVKQKRKGRSSHESVFTRTDLDTMSVRSAVVGTGTPGAARHDCTVKEELPDVELQPLPGDDVDSDDALQDFLAEDPAEEAPV